MITLPKVETLKPKSQPHNFFIWGATMSGKSYFASFFPNPLVLNTDGNSEQGSAPSIQIRNERNEKGELRQSAIKQIDDVILALQNQDKTKPQFETVVIDVIDDICTMFEQAICFDNGVQALADIPYGKGYAMFNTALQQFVIDLKALPMNVIYISRELTNVDEKTGRKSYEPSLKTKYYNIVNGNCDLVIRTQRLKGDNFYRSIEAKRTDYKPENITNKRVLKLLETIPGMFKKESK
ncbi:AAA family ATPase [Lactobacillus sp. ESL0677]|uniref:AAA family ATPase n=1 Tax=Lactobacillus sp. ESL0677 TaxID=2983208 RepID=UPI0023F7741E|nr:AAA family ATPase [Lactobacillus sp. ESL0677]WEV36244.1 AAA family ATPase [Lactobacillus sp. ESL0677]